MSERFYIDDDRVLLVLHNQSKVQVRKVHGNWYDVEGVERQSYTNSIEERLAGLPILRIYGSSLLFDDEWVREMRRELVLRGKERENEDSDDV